jgi:DNA-binding NarL/FixJ family response regulator
MIPMLVEAPGTQAKRTFTILLVDDSSVVRKRLKQMLDEVCSSCDILEADAPDSAIATLETREVDVVVMDIRMPGGSGMEAIAEIKREHPSTLVIMLTNYSDTYYRNKCLEMGADQFFDKSAEFIQVIESVRSLVNV